MENGSSIAIGDKFNVMIPKMKLATKIVQSQANVLFSVKNDFKSFLFSGVHYDLQLSEGGDF
jgi:hypothetical protein